MKHVGFVVTGMAVVAVTATLVVAAERGDQGESTTRQSAVDFSWAESMRAGDRLEIKGINGDINVSPAAGSEVVVTAEARGRKSDPSTVHVEVVEHAGGFTLCAVYPNRGGEQNYCGVGEDGRMNTRDNDVQVDFHIELPRGVDFTGRTVNGEVDARNLESDVRAITVNGDIDVSTTGFAEAETVNGSIEAVMGARELHAGAAFSTVNGSIMLDLDDDVDATLDASWLNGGFESDLPFTLEGRMSRRSAKGRLGDGGPELELSTVNGSIRIR